MSALPPSVPDQLQQEDEWTLQFRRFRGAGEANQRRTDGEAVYRLLAMAHSDTMNIFIIRYRLASSPAPASSAKELKMILNSAK